MKNLLLILLCLPFIGFGQKTYVPDNNFEFYLEANGMGDGIAFNDSVLTVNLIAVDTLIISSLSIADLTGIEDFTGLTYLICPSNQLTSLDISNNTNLTRMLCHNNQLTSLDVSNNTNLIQLICVFNQLTSLDVSNNTALTDLNCAVNQLTSLDVSNGNNINLNLHASGNPNLNCVIVDDVSWATANWLGQSLDANVIITATSCSSGCMDPQACNYDSTISFPDSSCIMPGCTDNTALNYSSSAGCDDGSCVFIPQGINYQAVARDATGNLLMNHALDVKLSIISDITTGNVSWQETHQVTTNEYGLFTAIIGNGTTTGSGSSATFDVVDWGASNHLLKVEIDYDGSGYVDMGTTALMSVPYALYSANSGAVGAQGPQGPVGANGVDGTNGVDGAQGLQGIQGLTGAVGAQGPQGPAGTTVTYSIGDFAHGGVVFWIDQTGQHGLVCATTDQSTGIQWYNGSYTSTESKGDGLLSGGMNTTLIIASQGYNSYSYAAGICANLQITEGGKTYGDWYLPSEYELNEMYLNKTIINTTAIANGGGDFSSNSYWSSTESFTNPNIFPFTFINARRQDFSNGSQYNDDKIASYSVRAIRAF